MRPHLRSIIRAGLVSLVIGQAGCAPSGQDRPAVEQRQNAHRVWPAPRFSHAQTVEGIGAGQGIALHDGYIYLYGDAETGIILQCRLVPGPLPSVESTGTVIRLTVRSTDLLPHPTGLTFDERHGCWMGDTVNRRGMLYKIDWPRALADGVLDDAVIWSVADTAAIEGCRPVFIEFDGKRLLATADYGDKLNALRLYDAGALARSGTTSDPGVVIASYPCGPWVQSLTWLASASTLVLVQNRTEGLGYKLTPTLVEPRTGAHESASLELDAAADELEGFAIIADGWGMTLSSSKQENIRFWRLDDPWPAPALLTK